HDFARAWIARRPDHHADPAAVRADGFLAVIASEAKQSSFLLRDKKAGLLRRFAPRNDGG
ncbi:MAG TPA: hypothetical protein VFH41_03210, partial [Bradyrhizobium sp.]|nr:hypothetical protein [Bradyrhizobium sp.]